MARNCNPFLTRYLFCVPLQTGAVWISILSFFLSTSFLVLLVFIKEYGEETFDKYHWKILHHVFFEEFKEMNFILMLITNIDCVLSSMVLLMGILKKSTEFFIPWLIMSGICSIFTIFIIYLKVQDPEVLMISTASLLITFYNIFAIVSYMKFLLETTRDTPQDEYVA